MTLLTFRTSTYTRNIYAFGTTSIDSIPVEYREAVKRFAAENYSDSEIKNAYDRGFISEQVYNETLAYKYPQEPEEEEKLTEPTP